MAVAPASCIRLASSGALISVASQPARIFTVTGIFTALAIAATTDCACSGSRIRLHPALCFAIFGTGQPMLMSTMSAPMPSTICAASAIFTGSPPKIWIDTGRSSSVYSAYSSVRSLPHEPADHALERPVRDLHHHPFADERTRIELQIALDEAADGRDLVLGDRDDLAVERHDVDDARAGQYGETIAADETSEAIAGKERPVELLLAILPAAPSGDRRKEGLESLALELFADDLLMPRPRPDRVPGRRDLHAATG